MLVRSMILAGTALFAVAASAQNAPTPAPAPTPMAAATPADEGAEIIVTAQKRSERLQDVPVAVSVVSGDTIAKQGRTSLEGAQYLVPSLNFVKAGTSLNQTLFLRGVGTTSFSIAVEPSVSTVLDGVVLSRAAEAFTDLVDIERLEVLRGPQSTLFGKNASAGVINIVSKRPGNELGGYVDGGYLFGNGAEYRIRGAIDLPFGEHIRSRTTAFYDKYDGNIFNIAPNVNRRVDGWKHWGVRSLVEADASETVKLTFIADYHHNNDDCCAQIIGGPPLTATGAINTANLALVNTVLPPLLGDKTRTVNQNLVTHTDETGYGFSIQGDAEVAGQTVTSITAYRNFKNTEIRDGDWLPQAYVTVASAGNLGPQVHDFGPQTGNTFSQELRLASPGHEFIDYVVGAYYSRAYSRRLFQRSDIFCAAKPGAVLPSGVLTPCTSPLAAPSTFPVGIADYGSTFKNMAIFGQGTLNLAPRFRLIGGVRYTSDQLDVFESRITPVPGASQPPFDAGVYNGGLGNGTPNGIPFKARAKSDNFSGKAGAQFDVTRGSTAYATYTRGYKGPAFNMFFNLTSTGTNVIAAETSNAYEVGLKNTLLDGRLTVNVAAFLAKYDNFQANNPDTLTVNGVTNVIARFTNAGKVSTRGGELDLVYRPVRDLNISAGAAYTDAHVDQFKLPVGGNPSTVVPNGTPLGFAPKWKGNVGIDYRIRTGGAFDVALGAQGSYQSKQLSLFVADPVQRAAGTIKGYGLVNLSASVMDKDDKYQLTFQVRNLLDQSFAASIANGGAAGTYLYQISRDADRYYGVTGRVNF